MSELMNASDTRKDLRWRLLTTASMLALLGFTMGVSYADASDDDANRPTVWIDLGGQLERTDFGQDLPAAPFASFVQAPLTSPAIFDKPPSDSYGAQAGISFQPEDTDWILSASLRYGRSNSRKDVHNQTAHQGHKYAGLAHYTHYTAQIADVIDAHPRHDESHAIADFQAGKDVGLGLFGHDGSSVLNIGVRFAQFNSNASTNIRVKPDLHFYNLYNSQNPGFNAVSSGPAYIPAAHYHIFSLVAQRHESFRAVGPSIAWNASQPFLRGGNSSELTFDWGMNAAILFGRQKTIVQHQTKAGYVHVKYYPNKYKQLYQITAGHIRDRAVVIPNFGGFAGVSFRYFNAKVSFGYRGDFFFGALDTGVDSAKRTTAGFYGPFATVSVGIGG